MITTVEARGVLCPVPIIRLARVAGQLPAGSLVELLSDDPAAEHDVPAWCRLRGHELLSVEVLPALDRPFDDGVEGTDRASSGSLLIAEPGPRAHTMGEPEPHAPNPSAGQGLRHVIRLGGAPSDSATSPSDPATTP